MLFGCLVESKNLSDLCDMSALFQRCRLGVQGSRWTQLALGNSGALSPRRRLGVQASVAFETMHVCISYTVYLCRPMTMSGRYVAFLVLGVLAMEHLVVKAYLFKKYLY